MGDRQPSKTIRQDRRPHRIPANNNMSMWTSSGEEITIDDSRHPNTTSPASPCPPREQLLLHPPSNIRARSGSPSRTPPLSDRGNYNPTSPVPSPRPTSVGVSPRPSSCSLILSQKDREVPLSFAPAVGLPPTTPRCCPMKCLRAYVLARRRAPRNVLARIPIARKVGVGA